MQPNLPPSKKVPKITKRAKAALKEKTSQKWKEANTNITKDLKANFKEIATKKAQVPQSAGDGKNSPPVLIPTPSSCAGETAEIEESDHPEPNIEVQVTGEASAKTTEDEPSKIQHCDERCQLI